MPRIHKHQKQIMLITSLLMIFVLTVGCQSSSKTQLSELVFKGRLILTRAETVEDKKESQITLYEFKQGMATPASILELPVMFAPLDASNFSFDSGNVIVKILDYPLLITNIATGEKIYDSNEESSSVEEIFTDFSFSPDGHYLVYAEDGNLYQMNNQTKSVELVHQGKCDEYTNPNLNPGEKYTVCTPVSEPYWINDKSYLFEYYAGELPGSIVGKLISNRLKIQTIDGREVLILDLKEELSIYDHAGNIFILYTDPHDFTDYFTPSNWMDVDELLENGQIIKHPISTPYNEDLTFSLSPNGQLLLDWTLAKNPESDNQPRITDLQSGIVTNLDLKLSIINCVWSPDSTNLACAAKNPKNKNGDIYLLFISVGDSLNI